MSVAGLPQQLLAKSLRTGQDPVTLERHSRETEQAASRLLSSDRRWGRNWCRFFKLPTDQHARFLLHVRVASLFHDLGKANADFYDAVSGKNIVQTLRHEHVSALVLHLPEVRAWLGRNRELDLEVITAAVLSHHLKAALDGEWKWCKPREKEWLTLFLQHPEVERILARVAEVAQLGEPPELPMVRWHPAPPWAEAWREGRNAALALGRAIGSDHLRRALLLATKVGVIIADAVSSGLVREGHDIDDWIDDVAHSAQLTSGEVMEKIISRRARAIERHAGSFQFQSFQLRAAEQGPRALLLAACGTGKTLAAWLWAAAQARQREIGRVIFLYPTRGTATEGFRDYVAWAPESEVALVHGTSRYELEAMLSNPSEAMGEKRPQLSEAEARLFSLGLWSRRFFSATVDQFLSFMEHHYGSLCLTPALADSAVIIDEVHSFDRHMFDTLISFLHAFDVPVLCMTATLPPSRRDELEKAGLRVYPTKGDRVELADLEARECQPRYNLAALADENEALVVAAAAFREGRRVLWVVNQVARAERLARRLAIELGRPVLCYHSRFRLDDRKTIHDLTLEAFKQAEDAALAVTTQVCEMSLDLDADVLITELAPVTSLVQRFGRANRHAPPLSPRRAILHSYEPENAAPYTNADMIVAREFLATLGNTDVSQRQMAEALERHARAEREADASAARLLESGYFATPGLFRDADDFSDPCVLDADLAQASNLIVARKPIDGLMVNVPRKSQLAIEPRPTWLPKYLGVASAAQYDARYGFTAVEGIS